MDGDRELLEKAATATGLNVCAEACHDDDGLFIGTGAGDLWKWRPLADDGDALRLAVRMAQLYGFFRLMRRWMVCMAEEAGNPGDPYAATRRAIVRAAAKKGEEDGVA